MINLKDKKILVTGGAGFIGKHLVDNLIKKRGVPAENIFVPLLEKQDLRRLEDCKEAVKGKDIVIHLAAVTGDIEFHRLHPGEIFYDNVIMGIQLMEAARLSGVKKFVSVGSVTAYPESAQVPFKEEDFWSGYPAGTHAPYSIAKKMLLVQGNAYRQEYGFNAIHLLLTTVFGSGTSPKSGYFIPSIIEKVKKAQENGENFIEAWGTGKTIRDFIHVDDAVEGILSAAERYDKPEPVNISSGTEISTEDLIKLICKLMNFNGGIRWDTTKPDGRLRRVVDISRAKKEFGFSVLTSLETGLRETIDWHINNKKL